MEISLGAVLLFVLTLCVGASLGYLFAAARGKTMQPDGLQESGAVREAASAAIARSQRLEEENAGLINRARQDNQVMQTLTPLLNEVNNLGQKVNALGQMSAAQGSELREQLTNTAHVQRELAKETTALRTALTSSSARGTWGEVELKRIIEASGMLQHVDFDLQQSTQMVSETGTAARPDVTVHLPGGGHLVIDAKVPLNSLIAAQGITGNDPASEAQRTDLIAAHSKALRGHINELVKRNYPAHFSGSPQLTIMFLPAESLLSEALSNDPTLLEYSLEKGVAPTTPSSLLALLRSVAAVWAGAQITAEAQEIMNLGLDLTKRLNIVAKHLDKLGSSLKASVSHYNSTVSSLEGRLLVQARKFESLESQGITSPKEVSSDDAQIRTISAGGLIDED